MIDFLPVISDHRLDLSDPISKGNLLVIMITSFVSSSQSVFCLFFDPIHHRGIPINKKKTQRSDFLGTISAQEVLFILRNDVR